MASARRPAVLFAAAVLFGGLAVGPAAAAPADGRPLARSNGGDTGSSTDAGGHGDDSANGVLVSLGSVLLLTGAAAAVLRNSRRVRP
ncbi:hypothetical protein [Kitasatospora sp. NPDC088134]|uniref:hypothetical protein n=1 Tax=Kitasatospora sp. NPDC088134 TaxID=3364071 RepID=UPI00381152A4